MEGLAALHALYDRAENMTHRIEHPLRAVRGLFDPLSGFLVSDILITLKFNFDCRHSTPDIFPDESEVIFQRAIHKIPTSFFKYS
jgi:hypothetical protein